MQMTMEEQTFLQRHGLKMSDFYIKNGQSTAFFYANAK